MNTARFLPNRKTIAILIALAALSLWIPGQFKLREARRALGDAQIQLDSQRAREAAAVETLALAQRDLNAEKSARNQTEAAVAKAERALAAVDPEARWATPPASLPEWNPESPYIWLRKEMVPKFPVRAFTQDGALLPEIAYVFTLDAASQRELNEKLKSLLAEYRALEVAHAERSEEHLPGIAGQKGDKITIRVRPLPAEGGRIKQQFEAALVQALGEQRAELLKRTGDDWLRAEFAQFGGEPKTISVIHHPGGSYNVSVQCAGSWYSTGGPLEVVKNQIPPHVRPMFQELWEPRTVSNASDNHP